ncbi:hypothetical protein EDD22DRAFT_853051 [Suillus occidentalis]|nr:hypothetical protein EDD22DRAFT_853051 [Suillus occidentalis]
MLDHAHADDSDARDGGKPSTLVLDPVTSEGLGDLIQSESPSCPSTAVPTNKEKTQARTQNEDQAALLKCQKKIGTRLDNLKMSESKSQGAAAAAMGKAKAETSGPNFRLRVVEQEDSCIAAGSDTRQPRKRKVGGIDNVNKENVLFPNGTPAIKRICREKTGTDWQTVLDVNAYSEEQRQRRDKDMAMSTVEEK